MKEILPITLIVPCRNEARNLEVLLPQFVEIADDVLVVDGHSTDDTRALAEQHSCRYVLDNGIGKGDGVRVGIEHARHEVCVFIDADCSHAAADIARLVSPLLAGDADLVLGSRMRGGSDEFIATLMELIRLAGNMGLTWLINLRCRSRLSDSQNGFRAARVSMLRALDLRAKKHTIEMEMTMRALRAGYRVEEVAAHESPRLHGESSLSIAKQGLRFFWMYFRECFRRVDPAPEI